MPEVLVQGDRVQCTHQGAVVPTGTPTLTVASRPVLLPPGIEGQAIACPNTNSPCGNVTQLTSGEAAKLRVGQAPDVAGVVTASLVAGTAGTGTVSGAPSASGAAPFRDKLRAS
jgi:hypothetical protein